MSRLPSDIDNHEQCSVCGEENTLHPRIVRALTLLLHSRDDCDTCRDVRGVLNGNVEEGPLPQRSLPVHHWPWEPDAGKRHPLSDATVQRALDSTDAGEG